MENFIHIYQNAYNAEYCNEVIDFFECARAAGFCKTRKEIESIPRHLKDDEALCFPDLEVSRNFKYAGTLVNKFLDPFVSKFYDDYVSNYSVLANEPQQTVYGLKIQKTCVGGGYHMWHAENTTKKTAARLSVFTLYLNTIEDGGETEFLYYRLRVKPEQGTLVIWPAGFTHAHRGNPPLTNTKYILTGWVESDT